MTGNRGLIDFREPSFKDAFVSDSLSSYPLLSAGRGTLYISRLVGGAQRHVRLRSSLELP